MNSSAGKGGREEGAVLPIVLIVVCVFLLFMTAVSSEVPVQNKTGRSYSEYFGTKLAVSGVLSMAQAVIARDPEWSGSLLYEANGISAAAQVSAQAGGYRVFTVDVKGTLFPSEYYGRFTISDGTVTDTYLIQKRYSSETARFPDT